MISITRLFKEFNNETKTSLTPTEITVTISRDTKLLYLALADPDESFNGNNVTFYKGSILLGRYPLGSSISGGSKIAKVDVNTDIQGGTTFSAIVFGFEATTMELYAISEV